MQWNTKVLKKQGTLSETNYERESFFSRTIGTGHCPFSLCRLFIASKDVPAHVIRPLVLLPDFTPSPLTLPIFQSAPEHTHKISAPSRAP